MSTSTEGNALDPEEIAEARAVIIALRMELNCAYSGLHTLPADHTARIAAERASKLLADWPCRMKCVADS